MSESAHDQILIWCRAQVDLMPSHCQRTTGNPVMRSYAGHVAVVDLAWREAPPVTDGKWRERVPVVHAEGATWEEVLTKLRAAGHVL